MFKKIQQYIFFEKMCNKRMRRNLVEKNYLTHPANPFFDMLVRGVVLLISIEDIKFFLGFALGLSVFKIYRSLHSRLRLWRLR